MKRRLPCKSPRQGNDRGVTINLVARQKGLNLDLVQEGLTFQPAPR